VHHQHYFPVVNDAGALKEAFLAVVNTQPSDERLIAKNAERVVTARLRDARFFWESDRKVKLEDRLDRLHSLTFHKKLQANSYRDKAERIETLARTMATDVLGAPEQADHAAKAARLAKADLVTDMVFEFPELQGVMGGIYAREEGQPEPVWKAIYYHYLPVGVEANAPPTRAQLGQAAVTWAAVSLADKTDSVASLYSAGERASGSRDPFGLRRAMNGVLRILLDLPDLTGRHNFISLGTLADLAHEPFAGEGVSPDLIAYYSLWLDRLNHVLVDRGFDSRNVRAVLWERSGKTLNWLNPLEARLKLEALPSITSSLEFRQLATAFKRVKNIARELDPDNTIQVELGRGSFAPLKEPAELELLQEIDVRSPRIGSLLEARDYRGAFAEGAKFGPAVDKFFAEVFVMVDDLPLKTARLSLMKRLELVILSLADISEIVAEPVSRT
jgi:glycyl-tRNA synthetase beta chain